MEKIRIKNLRSLVDTGDIELAPINIIIGENSSGKSTFTRIFPLLKQSINSKLTGPLKFIREENLGDTVDFGHMENVKNIDHQNEPLELSFTLNIRDFGKVKYSLGMDGKGFTNKLTYFSFELWGKKITFKTNYGTKEYNNNDKIESIEVDNKPIKLPKKFDKNIKYDGSILPEIQPYIFNENILNINDYFSSKKECEDFLETGLYYDLVDVSSYKRHSVY